MARGGVTSPCSWPSPWDASFSAWGPVDADPTSAVAGGADASRTLLIPLWVRLLSDCCTAANPAFDSGIFFTARCVFLLGAADDGGPEALVISTSNSLPTEESEENSISSAGWRSSAGAAASLPGSPSGRGVGDQYSKTLACKGSELCYNPTGALGKIEETTQNKQNDSEDSRKTYGVGRPLQAVGF